MRARTEDDEPFPLHVDRHVAFVQDEGIRLPGLIHGSSAEMIRMGVERYALVRGLSAEAARQRLAQALVGTPEQCVARLQAYVRLGIRSFFLMFPDLPDLASLQLFATTVLPAFRSGKP